MTLDYLGALNALRQLATGTDWFAEFEILETALLENLKTERLFGPSEQSRSDRSRLIYQLNACTRIHGVGPSFSKLCRDAESQVPAPINPQKEEHPNSLQVNPQKEEHPNSLQDAFPQKQNQVSMTSPIQSPAYGRGEHWAVLIGVDTYEDDRAYSHLNVCVHDTLALYQQLITGGFREDHIYLLTDQETGENLPKRENILAVLQTIAQITEPDDLLLFYFSGHGATKSGEGFLIPRNGRQAVLHDTAVSIQRVKEIMMNAQARAKVLILDACHSGTNRHIKDSQPMPADFIELVFEQATGFAIFSSCQEGQFSYTWPEEQCSVFTYYLLEALQGRADRERKGFVTVTDVNQYVTYHVKLWASKRQTSQSPRLNYLVEGEIMLVDCVNKNDDTPHSLITDRPMLSPNEEGPGGLSPEERQKLDLYTGGFEDLRQGRVHQELIKQLEGQGIKPKNRAQPLSEDILQRYRGVPLHAVFLYTSEDYAMEHYIKEHWSELDALSGAACDIHPIADQFTSGESAYDFIQNLDVVRNIGFKALSQLPGIFFWDLQGASEYISFGSHPNHATIRETLRILFEAIKHDPTMISVLQAKERLGQKADVNRTSHITEQRKYMLHQTKSKNDRQPIDIGIIITLQEEFNVFFSTIKDACKIEIDAESGRHFFLFEQPGPTSQKPYKCVTGFLGQMGPVEAIIMTERMKSLYNPQTLVMLGIAASIHTETRLGDVIIADSVDSYIDQGKAVSGDRGDTFSIFFSGQVYQCSRNLLHFARAFPYAHPQAYQQWVQSSSLLLKKLLGKDVSLSLEQAGQIKPSPSLIPGPLASGPLVVASTTFKEALQGRNRGFLGVEMEAGGMMSALYQTISARDSLVLRGICDYGDERKKDLEAATKDALRYYAMSNVTQLFWELVIVGAFTQYEESTYRSPDTSSSPTLPDMHLAYSNQPNDFDRLYTLLAKYTNDLDLKEICRKLHIEYNRLRETSHADRAWSLTELLDNQNRLPELEAELRLRFPKRFS